MIIFGGTQRFWYLLDLLNFKDDHVRICITTEIQFATDHCSGSGLCTVRGNLKFYIFGDNLQLWYLPMSNLIIFSPNYQTMYLLLIISQVFVMSTIKMMMIMTVMVFMSGWISGLDSLGSQGQLPVVGAHLILSWGWWWGFLADKPASKKIF